MSGKEQWAEFEKEEEEADMIEDSDQESADWSQTKLLYYYYYYTSTTLLVTFDLWAWLQVGHHGNELFARQSPYWNTNNT